MKRQCKEITAYIFFGALTTIVSIGTFALLDLAVKMNPLAANVISWVAAVLFAYITNRKWVFESESKGGHHILKEMFGFFAGRLLTLGIEECILLVFITWIGFDDMIVKVAAQIVVLVSNYLISKRIVFRRK